MAKDRPPSFQFYPADFLSSGAVRAMTLEARGAYVTLLCAAWDSDTPGVLPDDDEYLAGLSDARERWPAIREQVARAFEVKGGKWTQRRMVHERAAQLERFRQAQKGAIATNAVRWGSVAQRSHSESHSDRPSVTPSSSSSSSLEAKTKNAHPAPAARPESASTAPTPEPRAAAPARPPDAPEPATRPDRQDGDESPQAGTVGAPSRRDILSLVNGTAKVLRMPATITGKLDVDRVAKALAGASREDTRTGIQLAQRWWKAGCRHEGLIERLVRLWYERRASIANPFAYFNGPQFASIRASQAARMAEDEHAALLALERAFAAEARR